MSAGAVDSFPDWDHIHLVVFDVDGTLYDQRGLRLRMLREIALHATRSRSLKFVSILRAYRRIRETLGDELHPDFQSELTFRTAATAGCTEDQVRYVSAEWLERRPLRHLLRYRYPGLPALFHSLHRQGKKVGIFSDYPAKQKLLALELQADFVVCAGDPGVGVLKPQAKGLHLLMSQADVSPGRTVMVGDRVERDGLAARAANVRSLIRSRKPIDGWQTFNSYDDPLYQRLMRT